MDTATMLFATLVLLSNPRRVKVDWQFDLPVLPHSVGAGEAGNLYAIGGDGGVRRFDGRAVKTMRHTVGAGSLLAGKVYVLQVNEPSSSVVVEDLHSGERLATFAGGILLSQHSDEAAAIGTPEGVKIVRWRSGNLAITNQLGRFNFENVLDWQESPFRLLPNSKPRGALFSRAAFAGQRKAFGIGIDRWLYRLDLESGHSRRIQEYKDVQGIAWIPSSNSLVVADGDQLCLLSRDGLLIGRSRHLGSNIVSMAVGRDGLLFSVRGGSVYRVALKP